VVLQRKKRTMMSARDKERAMRGLAAGRPLSSVMPPNQRHSPSLSQSPISSKPIPQPVLAPHLRNNQRQYAQRILSVFDSSHTYSSSDYSKDSTDRHPRYHSPYPTSDRHAISSDCPQSDLDHPPRSSRLRVQDDHHPLPQKESIHYRSSHSDSSFHLPRSSSHSSNSPLILYTHPPPQQKQTVSSSTTPSESTPLSISYPSLPWTIPHPPATSTLPIFHFTTPFSHNFQPKIAAIPCPHHDPTITPHPSSTTSVYISPCLPQTALRQPRSSH
jgi:hypothetical protein